MQKILRQIAAELRVQETQVRAAVELLDGGASVPFIARYRKEATGGLDDIHLRELEARLAYLRELEERREAVLKSIDEQGKLTPDLRSAIEAAATKQDWKTCTCPTSPSAAPRARSPARPGWSAGGPAVGRSHARSRPGSRRFRERRKKARAGRISRPCRPCWTACATSCPSAGPRTRQLVQSLREWLWTEGLLKSKLADRQGREPSRRRQVPRLLRLRRADRQVPVAPRAWPCSAAGARTSSRSSWCCRWNRSRASPPSRRQDRAAPRVEPPEARRRRPAAQVRRLDLAGEAVAVDRRDLFSRLREEARRWRSRCSPRTCATCCWPRPAGRAW
jgi:hypothetical protein